MNLTIYVYYLVIVKVEKYCVWGQTLRETSQAQTGADHVHFVADALHVKVDCGVGNLKLTFLSINNVSFIIYCLYLIFFT